MRLDFALASSLFMWWPGGGASREGNDALARADKALRIGLRAAQTQLPMRLCGGNLQSALGRKESPTYGFQTVVHRPLQGRF